MLRLLLVAALLGCWVVPVGAAIYRWVDERGTVHFADGAPPAAAKASAVTLPPDSAGLSPPTVAAGRTPGAASAPVASAAKGAHQVELFVTSWCPWCRKAEEFFRARGIPVTIYDVERDREAAQRKAQLDPQRGVPFAIIDGTPVHGYAESRYRQALGEGE